MSNYVSGSVDAGAAAERVAMRASSVRKQRAESKTSQLFSSESRFYLFP